MIDTLYLFDKHSCLLTVLKHSGMNITVRACEKYRSAAGVSFNFPADNDVEDKDSKSFWIKNVDIDNVNLEDEITFINNISYVNHPFRIVKIDKSKVDLTGLVLIICERRGVVDI